MEERLPTTKGIVMVVVYAIMVFFSTMTFALRVYVRTKLTKRSWEDWAAGVAWFTFIVFCAVAIVGPFYGTGQHANLIPPEKIPIALREFYIAELTYVMANLAVKLSIALMLLRVAVEEKHKRLILVVTTVTQVYSVIFLFIFIFQCMPPTLFWTKYQGATNGTCNSLTVTVVAGYVYLGVTIVYDWTMAVLPWFIVRKMTLDLRTRRMIAVVLALGSVASIATLIRIPYVADLASAKDFLYDNVNLAIWACIETGLSIIASSAATLKPLFRKRSSHERPSGLMTPKLNTIRVSTNRTNSGPGSTLKQYDSEVSEMRQYGQSQA